MAVKRGRGDDSGEYVPADESSESSSEESQEAVQVAFVAARFVGHLQQWLNGNVARVRAAYDSGSGWEVWLHVELYTHISPLVAANDIVREPTGNYPGKGSGLRGDFLFQGMTVEIKAQTRRQSAATFVAGIKVDLNKIETLKGGAPGLVIGICMTQEAYDLMNMPVGQRGSASAGGTAVWYVHEDSSG